MIAGSKKSAENSARSTIANNIVVARLDDDGVGLLPPTLLARYYSSGFVRCKVFIKSRYLDGRAEVLSQFFFSISSPPVGPTTNFRDAAILPRRPVSCPSCALSLSLSPLLISGSRSDFRSCLRENARDRCLSARSVLSAFREPTSSRPRRSETFVIPKLSTSWQLSSISSFNCSTLLHSPFAAVLPGGAFSPDAPRRPLQRRNRERYFRELNTSRVCIDIRIVILD